MRARGLAAVLALGLGLLTLAIPPAQAAAPIPAEDEVPAIRVVVDELTPVVPGDGDQLRIRGRVISTSRVPITDVAVQLRRSSSPLPSRDAVAQVAAAPLSPEAGDPDDVPLPGTRVTVADELPPDGRRAFSIRVPIDSLGLPGAGTYVLSVEALGRESGIDEFDTRKGILRTFLPWLPRGTDVDPLDVVWLWPLADWPARSADGVLLDDQTPTELSPGGRLDQLLTTGDRFARTVSWLADPALLQTAADMADGYQVQQDGAIVVGDREQQAARWLDGLADATRGSELRTLPYADIDASAVTRAGMPTDVVRAVTQAPGIAAASLGRTVTGDLYWAPFGRIDRPALDVLASSGVTTLVLSSDAMPPTDEATTTEGLATTALPTEVGTIQTVLADPVLAGLVSGPTRSASDVITARQRFLAETAVLAQTLPADQSMRAVVVAPTSVRWTGTPALVAPLLRALDTATWMRPRSLTNLLQQPVPSASRQRGGYGPKARAAELPARYMARVSRVSDDLQAFTSIIDDPTGVSEPFAEALLRAESAAWRSQPETGERLLDSIEDSLAAETSRVRALSEGTITFSGDVGRVPVTIVNELDRSVTVGVTLRGNPPLRLSSEPLTGIRIEAGKMASVDIDARVVGGDPLAVDVQLIGPEGQDYGDPAEITVTSTAYARAAAGVVTIAFVAIAVFVVVGIIRRIRKARRTTSTNTPGPA